MILWHSNKMHLLTTLKPNLHREMEQLIQVLDKLILEACLEALSSSLNKTLEDFSVPNLNNNKLDYLANNSNRINLLLEVFLEPKQLNPQEALA